jgi:hypothetical protein
VHAAPFFEGGHFELTPACPFNPSKSKYDNALLRWMELLVSRAEKKKAVS